MRLKLSFAVLLALSASAVDAQQSYFVGLSGSLGGLQSPYGGSCAGDEGVSASVGAYAGRSFGVLELSAAFTHVKNVAAATVVCSLALDPFIPDDDGTYTRRAFDRGHNPGMDLASIRASVSHPKLRNVGLYAGGGVETREGDLALLTGATLRTNGAVRLRTGIDLAYLRAPYSEFQDTWEDGVIVSTQRSRTGSVWRRSISVWVGVELTVPPQRQR